MARKLRIAVSVFFGVSAVTLCVLWANSYFSVDQVEMQLTIGTGLSAESVRGLLYFWIYEGKSDHQVRVWSSPISDWLGHAGENVPLWYPMNQGVGFNDSGLIWMPHGFAALIFGTFAALTWPGILRGRFSLRTLLIATTLAAVVLGFGVWLAS